MKYGLYLTINGGDKTIFVKSYRFRLPAIMAMKRLSKDKSRIDQLANGEGVTCIEVLFEKNLTTLDYIQI